MILFQDSLINKKLKTKVFIQINIFFITIYAAIQMFGVSNVFFKRNLIFLFSKDVLNL